MMTKTAKIFNVGDELTMTDRKNCRIARIIKKSKDPNKIWYQVEYVMDDELAREIGEDKIRSQPFFGYELA